MKWRGARRSVHVQDRRGLGRRTGQIAGGGGLAALIVVGATILFPDLRGVLIGATPEPGPNDKGAIEGPFEDTAYLFVSATVAFTEDVWDRIFESGAFPEVGRTYRKATVVLYSDRTESGCGFATSDFGPFYCPADSTIYIDPSFYEVMAEQFDAPGDFAQAYVIAHEIAHHIQNVSGQLAKIYSLQVQARTEVEANRWTVRIELQADCYAGLWARRADDSAQIMEPGDLEEALRAAHQVGDDVIQRMSGQPVNEDQFTHGSSEQRMRWFMRGFESGDIADCDTYTPDYEDL